jgi:hypothetical protein
VFIAYKLNVIFQIMNIVWFNFSVAAGLASGDMMINVTGNCLYVISISGIPWLYSGPTHFQADDRHHSTADGTLRLLQPPATGHGSDTFGA